MISKIDILHIVKKLSKHKRLRDTMIHPVRDWTAGFGVAIVLFVGAAAYAGYTFLTFSKNIDEIVITKSSVVSYKKDLASEVLDTYRKRKTMFELLRSERSPVAAPSTPSTPVKEESPSTNSPAIPASE